LQVIEEEGTQANAARVGEVLIGGLMKLRDQFEVVGDVRGKGLMIGVELVTDKVRNTIVCIWSRLKVVCMLKPFVHLKFSNFNNWKCSMPQTSFVLSHSDV